MCSLLTGQACAGLGSTSSPQPAAVLGTLLTSLEQERKGSHEVVVAERGGDSHTHRRTHHRPLGAAGGQQGRCLAGQRGGVGPQADAGSLLPLFPRVTAPLTHHTRQTPSFPVGQLREVNRKPSQAGRPGHPQSYRSSSSWTLFSASGGQRRRL